MFGMQQMMMVAGFAALVSAANAGILITEVMYDPAGGNEHEYVELYNTGATDVDLTGYTIADADLANTFTIPSGTIPAGGTALVVRIDATARLLANYQNAWGDLNYIEGNPWPTYTNSGDTVSLFDTGDTLIAEVNYRASNGYPSSNDSASIYMLDVNAANPYDASNWALSQDGVDGAHFGNSPRAGDVGSPGVVVPEPATLVLILLSCSAVIRRR